MGENMPKKSLADYSKKEIAQIQYEDNASDILLSAIEATHDLRDFNKVDAAHKTSTELLRGGSFGGNDSTKYHRIIKECTEVYYTTPVIRNIIDLMVDFASEGLTISHKAESQKRFFQRWADRSGFSDIIPRIFHTLLLTGNCVVLRRTGKITTTTKKELLKANLKSEKVRPNIVPIGYTILNPTRITIENSEIFGDKNIFFTLNKSDIDRLKKPKTKKDIEVIQSLPPEFVEEAIKKGVVQLDSSRVTVLNYKKLPWQTWAFPLIFSALDDINFKKMLRQMDSSSAADVIKSIVLFKLGNMKEGFPPDKKRFQKLASLLKSVSSAKNIVWDDLISIETSYPPIDKILGKEKYEVVDRDILSNFGVSEVLVSGRTGNYSSGFLSVRTLQEKLETLRESVLREFIKKELSLVRRAVKFNKEPLVRFSTMSLRDESSEKKLITGLVDRKIVSPQTALESFNLDWELEQSRLEKSAKSKVEVTGPYDNKKEEKKPNGRPTLTEDIPQEEKRSTKPKGLDLGKLLARVYKHVRSSLANKHKNRVSKKLSKTINLMTLMAFESLSNCDNINDDVISAAVLKTHKKIKSGKKTISGFLYEKIQGNKIRFEDYSDIKSIVELRTKFWEK